MCLYGQWWGGGGLRSCAVLLSVSSISPPRGIEVQQPSPCCRPPCPALYALWLPLVVGGWWSFGSRKISPAVWLVSGSLPWKGFGVCWMVPLLEAPSTFLRRWVFALRLYLH